MIYNYLINYNIFQKIKVFTPKNKYLLYVPHESVGHKSIKFKTMKVKEKHLKNGKIFRDEIINEYKSPKEFIKERSRQQIN